MQAQNESLYDVLQLLWARKRFIILVCLVAGVVTAGISLLLPNYYEASTQFYAASPDLAQPNPLGNTASEKRIYGNDYDIDRLLSLSQSNKVKNFLIDSFELYKHYEIDPDSPKAKHKLLLKLDKLYKATKTKYDAVRLSFEDTNPQKAAAMADAARDKVESLASEMIKTSQKKLIDSYKASVERKASEYNAISDSLYRTRKEYNIFNTVSQGEAFGSSMVELEGSIENFAARVRFLKSKDDVTPDSLAITEAKLEGYRRQYGQLKKSIDSYNEGYTGILRFERALKDFGDQLNLDIERLKQLEAAYNSEVSAIHIVETAEVPVYKSRPKRSIIVLGALFLTFVLMSLWLVMQEQLVSVTAKS